VEVLPADVQVSAVDSTIECRFGGNANPIKAVRLGLGLIKGLKVISSNNLVISRTKGAFTSVEDLARRSGLDRADLSALAAADALASLAGHRRTALWETLAVDQATRLPLRATPVQAPLLIEPTEGENIVGDYATLLRERLAQRRIRTASEICEARNGQFIRAAGIVTCRQRPATASGVIFVTLEDETGYVNLIVWNDLAERQRRELLGSRLLAVSGEVQREGRVVHVLARKLEDLSALLGRLSLSSHDFH
jgi:error-prone DNA polymerase